MDANDISGIEPVVLEAGLSGTFEEHTSDQQVCCQELCECLMGSVSVYTAGSA